MEPLQVGQRVVIRRPHPDDRAAFTAGIERSREAHRPWVHHPTDQTWFEQYLQRCSGDDFEGLFVVGRDDAALFGVFNLSQIIRRAFQNAFLGYFAFEPHANRGYMTEALTLVLRHAFETLDLHRLEANVQPGNEASIALVRRAGFRHEGFSPKYLRIGGAWRDHERWAIVREDWQDRCGRAHPRG